MFAAPFIDLALKCRNPLSEACVWAKAFLPLSLILNAVVIGVPVFIAVYELRAAQSSTRIRRSAGRAARDLARNGGRYFLSFANAAASTTCGLPAAVIHPFLPGMATVASHENG